jgi:hypothetical protein
MAILFGLAAPFLMIAIAASLPREGAASASEGFDAGRSLRTDLRGDAARAHGVQRPSRTGASR